jgi:L-glyceraldehyde 3-phosphate reductase
VSPLQSEEGLAHFLSLQSELSALAQNRGSSVGQLAVAWVLRRSEISSAIVGARKAGQIKEICAVSDKPLFEEEVDAINQVLDRYESKV